MDNHEYIYATPLVAAVYNGFELVVRQFLALPPSRAPELESAVVMAYTIGNRRLVETLVLGAHGPDPIASPLAAAQKIHPIYRAQARQLLARVCALRTAFEPTHPATTVAESPALKVVIDNFMRGANQCVRRYTSTDDGLELFLSGRVAGHVVPRHL